MRGGAPVWGLGEELATPRRKKRIMLRTFQKGLGPALILWYDVRSGNGHEIWYNWDVRAWTGSIWLRIGTGGGHL
jgi:hypothetical protein